jgi:hypothetical protein
MKNTKNKRRDRIYNNPRADQQDPDLNGKHDPNKMLYDQKQSVLDKIRSVIRKRKISQLKANDVLWKGLT